MFALNSCVALMFIVVYGLLSMVFTVNLCVYHTRLVLNNVTTKEENKRRFETPFGNPYARNCWLNCCNTLFPVQSSCSLLKTLKWETDDDDSNDHNEANTALSNNQQPSNTSNVIYKNKVTEEDNILKHSIVREDIFNNEINKYIYEHTSETNEQYYSVCDERGGCGVNVVQQETAAQMVSSIKINNNVNPCYK